MVVEKDLSNLDVRVIKIPLGAKLTLISPLPPLGHWFEPLGFYCDIDSFIFENFFYDDEILFTWSKSENTTGEDNVDNKHKKETVYFYQSDLQAEAGAKINLQPTSTDESTTVENLAYKPPLGTPTPLSNVPNILSADLVAHLTSEIESVNQTAHLLTNNLNNQELAVKPFNQSNEQIAPLAEAEVKSKEQEILSTVEENNDKASNTAFETIANSLPKLDCTLIIHQDDTRTFTNLINVENLEDTTVTESTPTSIQQAQAFPNFNTQLHNFKLDQAQILSVHLESKDSLEENLPPNPNKSVDQTESLENVAAENKFTIEDKTNSFHSSNNETQSVESLQVEPILYEPVSSTNNPTSDSTGTEIFLPQCEENLILPIIQEIETTTDVVQAQVETPVLDSSQAQNQKIQQDKQAQNSQIDLLQAETETPQVETPQAKSESLQLITPQLELPISNVDNTPALPNADVEASVANQLESQPLTVEHNASLDVLDDAVGLAPNTLQSTPNVIPELSTASQPIHSNIDTASEAPENQSPSHKNRQTSSPDVDISKNNKESFDIFHNQVNPPLSQLETQSLQDSQATAEEAFQKNAIPSKNIETVTTQAEIETTLVVSNSKHTESVIEENIDATNQKTIVEEQLSVEAQLVLSSPTIEIPKDNASILSDTTPKSNLLRANPEIDVTTTQYNNQQQESVELQANKLNRVSEYINSDENDEIISFNQISIISPDASKLEELETTEQSYNSVVESIQDTTEININTEQSHNYLTEDIQATTEIDLATQQTFNPIVENIQATTEIDTTTKQLHNPAVENIQAITEISVATEQSYNSGLENIQATTEIDTTTKQSHNLALENIQATSEIDTTIEQSDNSAVENIQATTEIGTTKERLYNPAAQNIQDTTEKDATAEQSHNPATQTIQATTEIDVTIDKRIFKNVSEDTSFSDSQLMPQVEETANIELIRRDNRPQKSLDQQQIAQQPSGLDNEVNVLDSQNSNVAETITLDTSFIELKQIIQTTLPTSKDAKYVSEVITESNTDTQSVQNTNSKSAIQPNDEFSHKPPSKIEKVPTEQLISDNTYPDEKDVLAESLLSTQQQAPRQQIENTAVYNMTEDAAQRVQAETKLTSQKSGNLENQEVAPLLSNNLNTLATHPLGHTAPLSNYLGLLSELFKDTNTFANTEMLDLDTTPDLNVAEQAGEQEQTQQAGNIYNPESSGTDLIVNNTYTPSILPSWLLESFERIQKFDLSNFPLPASVVTQSELNEIISEDEIGANITNNQSQPKIPDTNNQDFPDDWSSISELLDLTSNNIENSLSTLNVLNVNPPIQIIDPLSSFFDNFIDIEFNQNQEVQALLTRSSEQYTPTSWSNIAELLGENRNSEAFYNQYNEERVLETANTGKSINSVESSLSSPDTPELTSKEESIILQSPDIQVSTSSVSEEEIEFLARQVYIVLLHRLKLAQNSQFTHAASTYNTWNGNNWNSEALFSYKDSINAQISTLSNFSTGVENDYIITLNSNLSTLVEEVYALLKYQLAPSDFDVENNFYSLML